MTTTLFSQASLFVRMIRAVSRRIAVRSASSVPFSYIQGQNYKNSREYFYYINHEGMLFLEDSRMKNFTSAYKDQDFLDFFYSRLCLNDTGRFENDFPYMSKCGRERNLLKCDDRPIVYTKLIDDGSSFQLGDSRIKHKFQPDRLFMLKNGRLYHPAPFARYALVKSSLADTLFPLFSFDKDGNPESFMWKGQAIQLKNGKGLWIEE